MVLCGTTFSDDHTSADLHVHAVGTGTATAIVETVSIETETVTVVKSIDQQDGGNLEIGSFRSEPLKMHL